MDQFQRMDMPLFAREDPNGWVFRVERYFLFYRMTNNEKIQAVEMAIKGDALAGCSLPILQLERIENSSA